MNWSIILAVISTLISSVAAKADSVFIAIKSCAAFQSIKKATNPGSFATTVGQSYVLLGKNKKSATFYRIDFPGAQPRERWVSTACGRIGGDEPDAASPDADSVIKPDTNVPFYVLALSWEPAFCEAIPDKRECRTQTADRADARQFSLHGLWPQPRNNVFCGVNRNDVAADDQRLWDRLPDVVLSDATNAALKIVMPGTQSLLDRHEWIKHGTCYPVRSAETYFTDSVRLAKAVNRSVVGTFVAENVGKRISSTELRARFDIAFGAGAGDRVRVACKRDGDRQLIAEITIGLKGDVPAGTDIAALIAASTPTDSGCPDGILDAVGLQ